MPMLSAAKAESMKREKRSFCFSFEIPTPVSATMNFTTFLAGSCSNLREIFPPSGVYLKALESRL